MTINCCGCNKKLTRLDKNSLEFVTKVYCSLECLKSFCFEHLQRCCQCNVPVEDIARIKYCTRFGTKVEQFCSNACLENYKKLNTFCLLCRQKIGVMFIDNGKIFCSLFCSARYNGKGINQIFFQNKNPCSVCTTVGVHHLEILKDSTSEFVCSKECIKSYNRMHCEYNNIKASCSLCGCKLTKCKVNFILGGWIIGFCSEQCSSIYLTIKSEIFACSICNVKKLNFDLIRRSGKKIEYFCSVPCLSEKLNEEKQEHDDSHLEGLGARLVDSHKRSSTHTRSSTESCIEVGDGSDDGNSSPKVENSEEVVDKSRRYKRKRVMEFLKKWSNNTTEEKSIQTSEWESFFLSKINSATQCVTSLQDTGSQTDEIHADIQTNDMDSCPQYDDRSWKDFIFTPFPVHVPTPVGMDAQFQIIPIFAPVPVPIPLPLLKKSKKKKACSLGRYNVAKKKDDKLTFLEVAEQFMLNNENRKTPDAHLDANKTKEKIGKDDASKYILIEEKVDDANSCNMKERRAGKEDTSLNFSPVEEKTEVQDASFTSSGSEVKSGNDDDLDCRIIEVRSCKDDATFTSSIIEETAEANDASFDDSIIEVEVVNNSSSKQSVIIEKGERDNASLKKFKAEEKSEREEDLCNKNIMEEKLLDFNEDSENKFAFLDIDIANAWSPDSDIFEIDTSPNAPVETVFRSKNSQPAASETEDVKLISQLFSECEISKSTEVIKASVGKRIWEGYVTEKSKDEEFMGKLLSKSTNLNDISKMDRCSWVLAFMTGVLQLNSLHPHLIVYVLLCIQKYFSLHSVTDSIFTCVSYQRASNIFFQFLQSYLDTFSSVTSFIDFSRKLDSVKISEDMLWESNQLGLETPCSLLFSIFYFNTKVFGLHSYEEHDNASYKDFIKFSKTEILKDGTPIRLSNVRFTPSSKHLQQKRKYPIAVENLANLSKCPVKIFEMYISKCPMDALSSRHFYFCPIIGCSSDAKVWFTSRNLPPESLSNMLNLTRIVNEIQDVLHHLP